MCTQNQRRYIFVGVWKPNFENNVNNILLQTERCANPEEDISINDFQYCKAHPDQTRGPMYCRGGWASKGSEGSLVK